MQRSGGKILIDALRILRGEAIFGVPGKSSLAAPDALYDTETARRSTTARQEGGPAFMASAYPEATNRPGCVSTRAPNVTSSTLANGRLGSSANRYASTGRPLIQDALTMTRLTGVALVCEGRAVRAVARRTKSGARGAHKPKQPGLRRAGSARPPDLQLASFRRLPDAPHRAAHRA